VQQSSAHKLLVIPEVCRLTLVRGISTNIAAVSKSLNRAYSGLGA